ncbi:TetR/AcrR family transcriptional regulator [Saccharothrix obliqua]|uniref:TetR/AcrR family transcriptional regulator n=1 Tax=Saccharothrix obliqua TaxID=2861747 RepID=UPI001C5DCB3B|nr:TetR family transcriptional regulator [Saccharothrix obliqua]MBW4720450.1 TetR family transcriptional regulator [Saccharothrix obliqua]
MATSGRGQGGGVVELDPTTASSTRELLLHVARQEIFERGFHGAGVRSIARRAGVDPGLVRHYFGSKDELLLRAVRVFDAPQELAAHVLAGAHDKIGERVVRFMLELWEASPNSLVRLTAALNSVDVADLARESFVVPFFGTIARHVSPDRPELRASLVAAQVVALALGRHLVCDPALTGAGLAVLTRVVGRVVQRYLTGPLA